MAEETNDGRPEQAENAAHEGAQAGEDWKAKYEELLKQSRKHEDRAKANYEKAEAALAAVKAERERERAVADVAKKAGVPADVLTLMRGDTAEELKASAKALSASVKSLELGYSPLRSTSARIGALGYSALFGCASRWASRSRSLGLNLTTR